MWEGVWLGTQGPSNGGEEMKECGQMGLSPFLVLFLSASSEADITRVSDTINPSKGLTKSYLPQDLVNPTQSISLTCLTQQTWS